MVARRLRKYTLEAAAASGCLRWVLSPKLELVVTTNGTEKLSEGRSNPLSLGKLLELVEKKRNEKNLHLALLHHVHATDLPDSTSSLHRGHTRGSYDRQSKALCVYQSD